MFPRQPLWQRLPPVSESQEEDTSFDKESLDDSSTIDSTCKESRTRKKFLQGCLLVFSHVFIFLFGLWIARAFTPSSDEMQCVKKTSHDSPLFKDLDIKYSPVRYNGSFLHETIYRQRASPQVDQAWEALGVNYRAMAIPEPLASLAGITPSQVRISSKYGGGYPANLEGLHHLHCLDLLRKALFWNYKYYKSEGKGAFINGEMIVEKHVTHCLDILRQQLMCSVDVGMLGQVWWDAGMGDGPHAFVDFNTVHVCRNFEEIRRWAEARQLAGEEPADFLVMPHPEDVVLHEVP